MSNEEVVELWRSRIADYRASDEGVAAWSQRNQVTSHQLFYWMRKLKKSDQQPPSTGKPRWVALSVEQTAKVDVPPILVRVGAIGVEVRAGFEPAVLVDVVRTLKTLC